MTSKLAGYPRLIPMLNVTLADSGVPSGSLASMALYVYVTFAWALVGVPVSQPEDASKVRPMTDTSGVSVYM